MAEIRRRFHARMTIDLTTDWVFSPQILILSQSYSIGFYDMPLLGATAALATRWATLGWISHAWRSRYYNAWLSMTIEQPPVACPHMSQNIETLRNRTLSEMLSMSCFCASVFKPKYVCRFFPGFCLFWGPPWNPDWELGVQDRKNGEHDVKEQQNGGQDVNFQ